jgi:hypothetical protein
MPMTSSYFRPIGVTHAVSVGATATSELKINNSSNDQNNTVALLNTGATSVAVKFGPSGVSAPVLPVSGSTTGDFVLPPNMLVPLVFAVPTTPSYVRMIGSGAGPSIVYVTPVGA